MHREEGIIDADDLGVTLETYLCDTACLHHYHLFFLEICHPSTFRLLRQGQSMTCDRLRGWQTFAPRGHRPAATSPRAILSPPIPATARVAEHVKMVPITITDYSVLVSSHHDPADNREQPRVNIPTLSP